MSKEGVRFCRTKFGRRCREAGASSDDDGGDVGVGGVGGGVGGRGERLHVVILERLEGAYVRPMAHVVLFPRAVAHDALSTGLHDESRKLRG